MATEMHGLFEHLVADTLAAGVQHPWSRSVLLGAGIWAIGLGSAAWLGTPRGNPALAVAPPVLAVLLIGVIAGDHWWTRGALLLGVPPLALGLWLIADAWNSGERISSTDWGVFLAGAGVVISLAGVAAAWLGVGVGRALRASLRRLWPPGDP